MNCIDVFLCEERTLRLGINSTWSWYVDYFISIGFCKLRLYLGEIIILFFIRGKGSDVGYFGPVVNSDYGPTSASVIFQKASASLTYSWMWICPLCPGCLLVANVGLGMCVRLSLPPLLVTIHPALRPVHTPHFCFQRAWDCPAHAPLPGCTDSATLTTCMPSQTHTGGNLLHLPGTSLLQEMAVLFRNWS